ncbi:metalloprotease TIKI2 [Tachysurus ichikawai]
MFLLTTASISLLCPPPSPPHPQRELNSFLWTVKRPPPQPPSYLFGTIHVPYTRVWDFVPESSKRAFQRSTSVFFELDLTDPVTVSKLASCQLLPNGESLRSLLPRDIYIRLKRHLDYVRHMMPAWVRAEQRFYADYLFKAIAGDWERKRPVWVMLMVNSLTEWDVRGRGAPVLDLFLAREAERMGKKTGAVENVEEQCHPLNGLSFSQWDKSEAGGRLLIYRPEPCAYLLEEIVGRSRAGCGLGYIYDVLTNRSGTKPKDCAEGLGESSTAE